MRKLPILSIFFYPTLAHDKGHYQAQFFSGGIQHFCIQFLGFESSAKCLLCPSEGGVEHLGSLVPTESVFMTAPFKFEYFRSSLAICTE
jgi:hypothetical protein